MALGMRQKPNNQRAGTSPNSLLQESLLACRNGFLAVTGFSFFLNLLMLTAPLTMMQIFTRVLPSQNADTLFFLLLIALFALITLAGLEMVRAFILIRLGHWIERRVSGEVLQATLLKRLSQKEGGDGVEGLRDLSTLRGFLSGPSVHPLLDAPWAPLFILVMFLLHPILGWISLGGGIVLFAFALANEWATRAPLQESGQAASRALNQAEGMVRNADAIQAMGMIEAIVARWYRDSGGALEKQANASDRGAIIASISKFIRAGLQLAVLSVGAWLALANELNPGAMIAASILMSRALAPVDQAITSWRSAVNARSAYQRLSELLSDYKTDEPAMSLPRPRGHLDVEAVTYNHQAGQDPVLRNLSFKLLPGESLGLIGPTAAGKTTLARLLVGNLRPRSGSIRLDGMELCAWNSQDRGRYLGYLPQDIELFQGTVNENIARMGEIDPQAVIAAAQLAGVHEMILRLPNGYDTTIGEGGAALSGGQRQRIALARALYGDPRLLVLDEPNANLDSEGENALVECLARLKARGCVTITIAHRPSLLRQVDKVLILKGGRIEAFGPRDEVLSKIMPPATAPARKAQL